MGCSNTNKPEKDFTQYQEELNQLVVRLHDTKKIILSVFDENGEISSFDPDRKYKYYKTIDDENTINEILSVLENVEYTDKINADFIKQFMQFYDGDENLIAEYEGHYFQTEKRSYPIKLESEKLFKYFD